MKEVIPHLQGTRCFLHRHALAPKTLLRKRRKSLIFPLALTWESFNPLFRTAGTNQYLSGERHWDLLEELESQELRPNLSVSE